MYKKFTSDDKVIRKNWRRFKRVKKKRWSYRVPCLKRN